MARGIGRQRVDALRTFARRERFAETQPGLKFGDPAVEADLALHGQYVFPLKAPFTEDFHFHSVIRMTITITTVSVCDGGNHVTIEGTTANGVAQTVRLNADRFAGSNDPQDLLEAFIQRCRSAVLEANANTLAQKKAALVGKTFSI